MEIITNILEKILSWMGTRLTGEYQAKQYDVTISFKDTKLDWMTKSGMFKKDEDVELGFFNADLPYAKCSLRFIHFAVGPFNRLPINWLDIMPNIDANGKLAEERKNYDEILKSEAFAIITTINSKLYSRLNWKKIKYGTLLKSRYFSVEIYGEYVYKNEKYSTYDALIPAGEKIIDIQAGCKGDFKEAVLKDLQTIANSIEFPNDLKKLPDSYPYGDLLEAQGKLPDFGRMTKKRGVKRK